jgi:glucans biosynthesis protein
MLRLTRRRLLESLLIACAAAPALAQAPNQPPGQPPAQPGAPAAPPVPRFSHETVLRRARDLATMPFDGAVAPLPEALAKLDFDAYRDIRFRPDRALLALPNSLFRMQMFHPGFLFTRTVTVNVVREGIATPVPYSASLFDYGRNRFDKPLPVNLGFAGFRLHYPLNDPKVFDELISFIGASYFRFLGRDQHYGLSARGIAVNAGGKDEEFPFFREFWVEPPSPGNDRIVVHALLDGPSVVGAYQFVIYPAPETALEVSATLTMRQRVTKLGIAPLTSMFFTGENDRRFFDDFRPELHDSDGLLIHSGTGEWIWRPLRNPKEVAVSAFVERNPRGFGLMQRDRTFEHYQDLDLAYEKRPSYWIEPRDDWGEGHVELVEIPTADETNDNIVASWVPRQPVEAGQTLTLRYRMKAVKDADGLHPGGRALNTYQTTPRALGSAEPVVPGARRFIIDFVGGDLAFYLRDPDQVQIVPSVGNGRILRTFLVPNHKTGGFRAGIDVQVQPGQSADLRAFLRAGSRALTETWTFPWGE